MLDDPGIRRGSGRHGPPGSRSGHADDRAQGSLAPAARPGSWAARGRRGWPQVPAAGRHQGRSWLQRAVIALNAMLIMVALVLAGGLYYGYHQASGISRVALDRSLTAVPSGAAPGERVLNILLVGSDSSAGLDPDDPVQIGRQGERFGDVIIIAHLDERTRDVALLSVPRDLWLPISGADRESRINRAFELGGPGALIDTIEDQFDIPIHHYVNVDFAGFKGLVEAVGSVDVFFERPARDWNVAATPEPRTQTGFYIGEAGCHALDPETALAYVRSRYYQTRDDDGEWVTDPTSDFGRIRRQQDFLRRLLQEAIDKGARNPFVLNDLIDAGLDNVAIDQELTPQLLVDLGAAFQSFRPEELQAYSMPATDATIDGNQVLLPRSDDVEPILRLFRGVGFDHPSTVPVTVVTTELTAASDAAAARELATGLRAAGFTVATDRRDDAPAGRWLVRGPDGLHSATMVGQAVSGISDELALSMATAQSEWVSGRGIELVFGPSVDGLGSSRSDGGSADGSADGESFSPDGSPAGPIPANPAEFGDDSGGDTAATDDGDGSIPGNTFTIGGDADDGNSLQSDSASCRSG